MVDKNAVEFESELEFEKALTTLLTKKGWEPEILNQLNEDQLLDNWATILYENNRSENRLGSYPLTSSEMDQILEQIRKLRTPVNLNAFINGINIYIKRENKDDKVHFGKEIPLKIYDPAEVAIGKSRYQIVRQPRFDHVIAMNPEAHRRRGDFMLLINGMPLIHVELKKDAKAIKKATGQIETYSKEGVYTGLFSLVQIFVAMTPSEMLYFANPGPDGVFDPNYYFHYADAYNKKINDWQEVASWFLYIPMAHQLIGYYTVADHSDDTLKVLRSYQIHAVRAIESRIKEMSPRWNESYKLGGYIWHTTGSGKTLTSFKVAQLISTRRLADKVVFLMDRIELTNQTFLNFCSFANEFETVNKTKNANVLKNLLKSDEKSKTLIVTSIQKMSRIYEEGGYSRSEINKINCKRLVFVIDECHRSTFGDMLPRIKKTFPKALFFGFSGTPIQEVNAKKGNSTDDVFGKVLHAYTIGDGIEDGNVLPFDKYPISTYSEQDLRHHVGMMHAKLNKIEDLAVCSPKQRAVYLKYQDPSKVKMAGYYHNNRYVKGIEDDVPESQYNCEKHHSAVVNDILNNWFVSSCTFKFCSLFATSSIKEACAYYSLFKKSLSMYPLIYNDKRKIRVACLFDPNLDFAGGAYDKEKAMIEMLRDYNSIYSTRFTLPTWGKYKEDICLRMCHKGPYIGVNKEDDTTLDLLIVVDQLLTGFDSKWLNTLYLDKVLYQENVIQAFSRTNRLFGIEKPAGVIKYYRRTNSMARNIEEACDTYAWRNKDKIYVSKLPANIEKLNLLFKEIKQLFDRCHISNFEKLPDQSEDKGKFAELFVSFATIVEAAKVQGVDLEVTTQHYRDDAGHIHEIDISFGLHVYNTLLQRYRELIPPHPPGEYIDEDIPFDINTSITKINDGLIDAEYMNRKFERYFKELQLHGKEGVAAQELLDQLYQSFSSLSQSEQEYAYIIINDVQSGKLEIDKHKTFRDYILEYMTRDKNDMIHNFATKMGITNENLLRDIISLGLNNSNINEYGRLDKLKNSIDFDIAKSYIEKIKGKPIANKYVMREVEDALRKFIIDGIIFE